MSSSRFSTARDKNGKIPVPDSASKPFPRIHSRIPGPQKSANSNASRDKKEAVRGKGASRRSSPNDNERYDSAQSNNSHNSNNSRNTYSRNSENSAKSDSTRSNSSDDDNDRPRARSPVVCQCSCHDRDGRKRSTSRDRRRSTESLNKRNGNSRRGSAGSGDDDDERRIPPIEINDKRATQSNKGSFFRGDRSSKYQVRSDSKTSQLSITGVGDGKKKERQPFTYYGRSHSMGDLRNNGDRTGFGASKKNDYDYAREDFLTPRFTSEYKARYEMKHGQRYTIGSDRTVRYIDPAGEHILVPKQSPINSQLQRTVSDSDIPSLGHSRNNKNVRLEPLDKKINVNGNKGAAVTNENVTWMPAKRHSTHSLPPMEKTPAMPDVSKSPRPKQDIPHPLGLSTPPKRNSQLYPI